MIDYMKSEILAYIQEEILDGELAIDAGEDLLNSGFVDSMGFVRLVGFLEEQFGVEVPPEDMTIEHFQSVNVMVAYLEAKLKAQSA